MHIHRSRFQKEILSLIVLLFPVFQSASAKTFRFDLGQEYDLAKKRTDENRYHVQETVVRHIGLNGI